MYSPLIDRSHTQHIFITYTVWIKMAQMSLSREEAEIKPLTQPTPRQFPNPCLMTIFKLTFNQRTSSKCGGTVRHVWCFNDSISHLTPMFDLALALNPGDHHSRHPATAGLWVRPTHVFTITPTCRLWSDTWRDRSNPCSTYRTSKHYV